MKLFIILLLFSILPVFAQENIDNSTDDSINDLVRHEHSKMIDGINHLVDDPSHSEMIDIMNQHVDDGEHSSMMKLVKQFNDINLLNSYTGLVLGIIAIIITINFGVIAWNQNKKSNMMIHENQILTTEIQKDTKELTEIRKEVKEDVSFTLKKRLHFVKRNLKRCQKLYEDYQNENDSKKKEGFLNSVFENFDRCYVSFRMDIDLIKIMEIFGRAIGIF